ncbi:MAG: CatB-related O-acetyltransferase [Bacteroidales bacterium]|nr:CatB-related O-acetyltransferase [Bacteroidales bacterium]
MTFLKKILTDIKTYYKINSVYPRQYKNSKIESYIVDESILGEELIIRKDVFISNSLKRLGSYTYIGDRSEILNCDGIGRYVSISHDVKIGLENHKLDGIGTSPVFYSKQRGWVDRNYIERQVPVAVGDDVLISANAMIMSGVKIGTGAVVGAGAFVNKDVPPYAIVAGIPAKIIRYRFDEATIERLLKSEWWKLDKSELVSHKDRFSDVKAFLDEFEKR